MTFNHKKVLVTGATGFIGSHLVQRLVARGAKVLAIAHYRGDPSLCNLEYLTPDEMSLVEVIKGNVKDPFFIRHAVEGCDVVFHLAALVGIPYSYVAPASYVATNIDGTLNILEACKSEGTHRLVHTSTSECYGSAKYTPIDEQHPLGGQSPYSASKIGADKIVESYHKSFGLSVVTIRPFNTFGPRQTARAVVPTIITQLLHGIRRLRLGTLSSVRDFTFVTDTADGLISGALAEGVEGEVINLGVGKGITMGKLAEKIMKSTGISVPIETEKQRLRPQESEVLALISDNRKAYKKLGWEPQVSLEEGLVHTIEFIQHHKELFQTNSYRV